jgi:hypothetical protein
VSIKKAGQGSIVAKRASRQLRIPDEKRLERNRWRGGRCASDTSEIIGFNRVLKRLSPLAPIPLLLCLLRAKVDSIPIA